MADRIIRVTKCAECRYCYRDWRKDNPYCGKADRIIWLTNIGKIHELCPLEVEKEKQGE